MLGLDAMQSVRERGRERERESERARERERESARERERERTVWVVVLKMSNAMRVKRVSKALNLSR